MLTTSARLLLVAGGSAVYLALAVVGAGGFNHFARPPLVALVAAFLALSLAAVFAGGNVSPGVREDRGNRWVIAALSVLGLLGAWLPAYTDRSGLWTFDGDAVRWAGVALFIVGGALRLWPVYVLGNRFSGLVAIQPGHVLVTDGIYSRIRHPSYLGLLVNALGWGLAFRSAAGVLIAVLMVPVIVARIRAEETLLSAPSSGPPTRRTAPEPRGSFPASTDRIPARRQPHVSAAGRGARGRRRPRHGGRCPKWPSGQNRASAAPEPAVFPPLPRMFHNMSYANHGPEALRPGAPAVACRMPSRPRHAAVIAAPGRGFAGATFRRPRRAHRRREIGRPLRPGLLPRPHAMPGRWRCR